MITPTITQTLALLPTDIINNGEIGSSIYFMEKGEAAVVGKDGSVHCILQRGGYFGEGALLSARLSSSSVKALTYCDVFELSRDDFQEIVDVAIAPALQRSLHADIKDSLRRNDDINRNIMKNFKERPKCATRVSREFLPTESIGMQRRQASGSKKPTLYSPDSVQCTVWNVIVVLAIVYNLWMVPFRLAFSLSRLVPWIDWSLDCILGLDMFFSYCKFAYQQDGELIFDLPHVKSHYVKTRVKLDILSTLPLDLVYVLAAYSNPSTSIISLLRIPRLIWVIRVPKFLDEIFRFLEDTDTSLAPLKLVEFLSGVILIAHWAGCGFYALARMNSGTTGCDSSILQNDVVVSWATELAECKWEHTWISRQIKNFKLPMDGGNSWQQYLRALNWALPTLVVVVIGDVVPVNMQETLYVFLWIVVGVSVNAAIIGNVANIVANIDTDKSHFAKKADEMKNFMKGRQVSASLRNRVDLFMSALWEHSADINGDSFLAELPKTLQIQVTERTRLWHISHCPFFDFCSAEIVKALSLRLKLALFSSGDVIVTFGDLGQGKL